MSGERDLRGSIGVGKSAAAAAYDDPVVGKQTLAERLAPATPGLVPLSTLVVFRDTMRALESERTLKVTNPTASSIDISTIEVTGDQAADFLVERMTPIAVAPGAIVEITIKFKPLARGPRNARLILGTGAAPITIALAGSASQERWDRAANAYLEGGGGFDEGAAHMEAAGFPRDEAYQVQVDLQAEDASDWRSDLPGLKTADPEFGILAASLYPGLDGEQHHRRLVRHRFRTFRDILADRLAPALRPTVPTGLRRVRQAFEEHGFTSVELSVMSALDRDARTLGVGADGIAMTREVHERLIMQHRYEAGRALQSPGGTLGYALGGVIFGDDEDRKLALAGIGDSAWSATSDTAGARATAIASSRAAHVDSPMSRPMEPDKPTEIVREAEVAPPPPHARVPPQNHGGLYTMDAPNWPTRTNDTYGTLAAGAVDQVNRDIVRAAVQGGDLRAVLDALAAQRQHIATLMGDLHSAAFGTRRTGEALTPYGDATSRYAAWNGKIPETSVDRLSSGRQVRLTEHYDTDHGREHPMTREAHMRHAPPANIEPILTECQGLYTRALDPSTSLEDTVRTVGELHWWLAHAMPYERGSAAITDMLTKSIFLRRGIQVSAWQRGVVPDLDAFTMPRQAFVAAYQGMFREAPR